MALQTEADMMLSAQDGIILIPFNLFYIFSHLSLPAIYWNHVFNNHIPKELLKLYWYWQQGPIQNLFISVERKFPPFQMFMDPVFPAGMILYFVHMILKSESIPSEKKGYFIQRSQQAGEHSASTPWVAMMLQGFKTH